MVEYLDKLIDMAYKLVMIYVAIKILKTKKPNKTKHRKCK